MLSQILKYGGAIVSVLTIGSLAHDQVSHVTPQASVPAIPDAGDFHFACTATWMAQALKVRIFCISVFLVPPVLFIHPSLIISFSVLSFHKSLF